jgi:hypothetical protein
MSSDERLHRSALEAKTLKPYISRILHKTLCSHVDAVDKRDSLCSAVVVLEAEAQAVIVQKVAIHGDGATKPATSETELGTAPVIEAKSRGRMQRCIDLAASTRETQRKQCVRRTGQRSSHLIGKSC